MPVEITQEEMNILNLNGISAEDVRANVEFSRASGLDDFAIRQQFTNTLNELKPITKTSANDIEKINEWQNKGEMKPFELANRSSMFFNGTYDNIDNSANLTAFGKALKNSSKNQLVEDRIENQRKEKEARDERVNNGSASFFDRVGSALDRWGKNVYNAQLESAELNKNRQGVDESDSTKRYEVVGIDRAGQPIYNEIDLLHKIGFREGMADTLPKGIAIGAIAEAFDTKKEREIKDKILKGEAIRQDELDFINRKMDFEQEKKVRGYSIGGQIGSTVGYGLGFSADLLTGSALFKALGAGAIGTTLTTNISNVAKGNQALQTAGKAIGWGTNRLAETALTTIVNSPSRLFQGYQERMLNNEMKLTDNGNAVFSISQEKPATALFKSLQSIFVEYFTEIAGGEILRYAAKPIAKAGGKVAQAVENSLIKNLFAKYPKVETLIKNSADVFSKKFEEFNNLKVVGQSKEWIKNQVHFDGFLEEMGEEALADVLNLTLGTNNEERSFENYAKAIFKTPEEWAVLAGAIAIQGAGLSMVGASVANNMAKNGASPEEIQTVIENLTENQLRDLQAEQIADGAINIDETEEQHFEKTVNTVADSLIESGQFKDREKADKAVRLGATMLESISKKTGKSLDDLMAEDMAEINETEDYGVIDENGVLQGNVEYREVLTVENRINALLDEIELFNDETNPEDIDRVVSEISLLENLNSGDVSIEDIELANDMIAAYEAEGNTEFANLLRTALDDASAGNSAAYFQRIDESNIENEFGETVEDLTNIISEDVKNILADNFVEEDEFKFEDIRLYGSYTKGRNKETSDLDVLVQYSGTMREDGAFNMFADAGLSITDKNGRTVKIDINPINIADSGTINEHIDRMEKLEQADKNVYYQEMNKTLLDGFRDLLKNIINNNQKKEMFTVSELLPHIPAFSRIRNFFNGIENVKVELVSDTKNELKNGYYRASDDTVRINKDALFVSEMPLACIETLLHELQHAHQKRNYDKYKNILAKNLNLSEATKERLQNYIDNYEAMKEATKVYRKFREKNKKQLAELDAMKKQLGKAKMLEELKKRENAKLAILYKQNKDLYNNYKNSSGEMEARIISRELINQMGYGEIYDNQRRSFLSSLGNSGQPNASGIYGSRSSGRIGRNGYNNRGRSETNRLYQSIGEDSEGTENISGRSLGYSEQQRIFIDNQQAEVLRDRYQKVKGSFIPAENIITLFKDADESTIVHEFAHWWLDKLVKYAEENEEIAEDLKEIRKFVRNNGGAFTTEEHERFARGFEAYIRTGSAKTNRLKRLFEDFKNALLSLYDSIKNLGFSEEEMPQINNLFERLLTTENQRIQAAVFDRCDKIQEQIQEIRDNQEKELADIDEIYQNNIERNLKDNKKKQQVNEYIRLAQKSASRIPKAVREYQDRYKQATLEILEVATGYKRQFIANPRNWETIEQKIADLSDEITSGDGMRDNWREFYFDTGVSYDNDEIDGDYKLAEQAFKVLTSGDYSQAKDDRMDDEEIGKFFGMFDYLKGKVLSLRGENKDAAYEALTSIFNNMPSMPNEAVQELVDELQKVGEQFIDQKAMESPNKFSIPNVSAAVQFRAYVISKLHNMKVYDPESKRVIRLSSVNKLYNILKYANSVLDTKEIIRKINAHAILQLENRQKHILDREIQKQVRINSKLVKVGALKKGKFDWKTNTIFSELVQMNRLNIEDARKEYNKLTQADKIEIGEERESWDENPTESLAAPTDFQAALKIKFLEYKSNKTNDRNLLATRSLLEDIIELKFEGRRAKNEEELKKNLSRYDYETNLVQILNRHRYNGKAKFLAKWVTGETPLTSEGTLANWESILTTVFNRETAAKYSLLKDESDAEVFAFKKCAEFYDKAAEIYHFEKPKNIAEKAWKTLVDFNNVQPLANLFREYENEMTTVIQVTYNKDTNKLVETNVEISRAEIITLYAWSLNKELKERLKTQYGVEQLEEMFSKLSDEDKQFAWLMVDICDSMYNESNEVFIRTTGLSLPRLENYVPSKTERVGSDIDMLHEHIVRSTNPSFIKSRKNCKRIKMDPQTPFAIILPHINKTARYIVLSEKVNFYNRIFASNDIQATLIDIYGKKTGKKIHQVLLNQLGTSTYANYAKSVTVGKSLLDQVASNYITSRIGGNMKVMLSQLTGLMNYAENMPAGEWAKRFAKVILKPKATVKYMFENCDYLKARIAGNSINEVLSTVTNEVDRFRTFRNFCISNTKFGDVLTLCLGGKPYVDYLMEQGLSKEEAFKKYVEDTLRAQQSGHNSATSAWQKKQAETPINRMIFAFNNTNLQFERKFVEALSNYSKKDITGKEFAKAFVIYKVLNPVVFSSFLTNLSLISLFRAIVDGDDEEGRAVGIDILEALALANLKAYGLLGIVADCLCRFAFSKIKKERYFETQLPLISDIEEQLSKMVGKDDLTLGDYVTALCAATDYTTGIAATRIKNSVGGFGDIAEGEYGTGLLRLLGYGKYRATVAATGEEPKRKKK